MSSLGRMDTDKLLISSAPMVEPGVRWYAPIHPRSRLDTVSDGRTLRSKLSRSVNGEPVRDPL